ncbi:ABC transporter permease [Nocardioides piscis]|uniref:ABC transporter permease n=1 Tax=Nocardioides piscis TaxID=2714938 RepID=A0A6G7YFZ6_9ACTN|nr:ABC transporter permease [Nocardioides piscis]QIK75527.1 ABC transporter permease [Nocardioides piscis]
MSTLVTDPTPAGANSQQRGRRFASVWLIVTVGALAAVSLVRVLTGANEIDSRGSIAAAITATCPILLAALGGLWSERAGVVNIGLEGQMILGTWGAAYFTYWYGPWTGIMGAIALGALGGLIHAIATVTFGVDHIVSGVAINLIGLGLAAFLAEAFFADLNSARGTGGQNKLTGLDGPGSLTVPGVSDALTSLGEKHWFLVSDVASILAAFTTRISLVTLLVLVLVAVTAFVLWRTTFGLRLRSCGENPQAAESLGINVMFHKYAAVIISGGFAGLGGGYLALVSASGFSTGQTNGRGYIGLAAMIFGNWRPGGILLGSGMFGYTDSLRLRDSSTIHALLLLVAIGLAVFAVVTLRKGNKRRALVLGVGGLLFALWFLLTDEVPREFTSMTPYVATLLVLAFAAQRLRMPKADGQVYRKGSAG